MHRAGNTPTSRAQCSTVFLPDIDCIYIQIFDFAMHQHSISHHDHQHNNIFNDIHSTVDSSLTSEPIIDSFFKSVFYDLTSSRESGSQGFERERLFFLLLDRSRVFLVKFPEEI